MAEKTLTFQGLPQEIQDWLSSESVESIIEELQKKYQLKGYAMAAVSLTTTWLVLGVISPEDFFDTLVSEFSLPAQTASALAKDIAQRILLPIKNGLKRAVHLDLSLLRVAARPAPQKRAVASVSPLPSQTASTLRGEATKNQPSISAESLRPAPQPQGTSARTTKMAAPIFNDVKPRQNVAIPKEEFAAPTKEPLPEHQQARVFKAPNSFSLSEAAPETKPATPPAEHHDLVRRADPHPAKPSDGQ